MSALEQATRDAVDWLLLLERVPPEDAAHARFRQWLTQQPEHPIAWQRVNGVLAAPLSELQSCGQLPMAVRALRRGAQVSRRGVLGGGVAGLLLALGGAAWLNRLTPVGQLFADLHTGTGEHRHFTLADGSLMELDARSAVDVEAQRDLYLKAGAMLLSATQGGQPMRVRCRDGELRCDGAILLLRQLHDASVLGVQQGTVLLRTAQGASQVLGTGQVVRFGPWGIERQPASMWSRSTWTQGHLDVRDEPLGDVVEALRPYRAGLLRVSPQAAQLRVYGSFPLAEVDRTLQALAETLPIEVSHSGFWLTSIDVQKG